MWRLFQTAKSCFARPSALLCIADPWLAYQFDAAVSALGNSIESALYETDTLGDKTVPRYTLQQLLDPQFRLPETAGVGSQDDLDLALFKGVQGIIVDQGE